MFPISSSVLWMGTAYWQFRNKAPNSASAADATMLRSILHTTYTMLLSVGELFLIFSVPDPIETHVHCFGLALFDGSGCYA